MTSKKSPDAPVTAYHDYKQLEGARILPLMGAVGTLPGAALVLNRPGADCGAPLFVAALVFIAAAYMMWMCSDAVFASDFDSQERGHYKLAERKRRVGYYMSWSTLAYGIASLASSIAGFAGVHSTIRTPISVNHGFFIAIGLLIAVAIHVAHATHLRNIADDWLPDLNDPLPNA